MIENFILVSKVRVVVLQRGHLRGGHVCKQLGRELSRPAAMQNEIELMILLGEIFPRFHSQTPLPPLPVGTEVTVDGTQK